MSAMDVEFDDVARWTVDAVERLGAEHAVPAACRGSASPAALDWLAHGCGLGRGVPLLDVGGGMGGPAAYAARSWAARPVVVEPALGACRAARLFPYPVLCASGDRLPVRTAAVGVAWCLGVLCTVADKAPLLAELQRVLRPGGALGLLVLVGSVPDAGDRPEGNHFPSEPELAALLDAAGFAVQDQVDADALAGAPPHWQERIDRVDADVDTHHGRDPRFAQVQVQEEKMSRLLDAGTVAARYLVARPREGLSALPSAPAARRASG